MSHFKDAVLAALLLATAATPAVAQGQERRASSPEGQEAAAQYAVADIRVMVPGVIYNAGLLELATAYAKETGKRVAVSSVGMGNIITAIKTANPAADVVSLPFELMSTLSLDAGVLPGTFLPLGRSEMGLAVLAGAPHPDISSVEKLAAALRGAKAVMRSNPAGGSMVAKVIEDKVIKRAEFAGVNSPVSTQGEGARALERGQGDMAIQAISEILPSRQIELVGPLPRELAAWMDMAVAISARTAHREEALAFLNYLLRPESAAVWNAKGLERYR